MIKNTASLDELRKFLKIKKFTKSHSNNDVCYQFNFGQLVSANNTISPPFAKKQRFRKLLVGHVVRDVLAQVKMLLESDLEGKNYGCLFVTKNKECVHACDYWDCWQEIHSNLDCNLKRYHEWDSTDLFVEAHPDIGSNTHKQVDMKKMIGHKR